jgi:hypothetical protein
VTVENSGYQNVTAKVKFPLPEIHATLVKNFQAESSAIRKFWVPKCYGRGKISPARNSCRASQKIFRPRAVPLENSGYQNVTAEVKFSLPEIHATLVKIFLGTTLGRNKDFFWTFWNACNFLFLLSAFHLVA